MPNTFVFTLGGARCFAPNLVLYLGPMDYLKNIEPVTTLKTRSSELIKRARKSGQPVIITQNGKPTAVLQDVESYQRQRDTLLLLQALVQGDVDYREGRSVPHEQAKARLADKLDRLDRLSTPGKK